MNKKIKSLIAGLVVSAVGYFASPAAAGNDIEIMAGNKNTVATVETNAPIGKANIYTEHIINVDYKNNVGYFGLADAAYNIFGGLDGLVEVQAAPGMGVVARPGIEYFHALGNASVFAEATVGIKENPDGEVFLKISYSKPIANDVKIVGSVDGSANADKNGLNFAAQKARAGVSVGDYSFGAAGNLGESGGKTNYNIGGFVKKNF